ncbi:MAG: hypothetical protein IH984_08455 [Planctomycetes bacterium]|nr:hypothetical protein [Planctomycetota bacterium]
MSELHRNQAWELLYHSRLSACYWQKVLSKLKRRRNIGKIVGAFFVLGASLIGIREDFSWVSSVIGASVALVATFFGTRYVSSGVADAKDFCKGWIELRTDFERLWRQGEHINWNTNEVVLILETLSERERNYQAKQLEDPDNEILVECERALHQRLGLSFSDITRKD